MYTTILDVLIKSDICRVLFNFIEVIPDLKSEFYSISEL